MKLNHALNAFLEICILIRHITRQRTRFVTFLSLSVIISPLSIGQYCVSIINVSILHVELFVVIL